VVILLTTKQQKLVEDSMALVNFMINRYFPLLRGDEDAFQTGCVGLCKAARQFDESKGFKFSTLASKCIWGELVQQERKKQTQQRFNLVDNVFINDGKELSIFEIIDSGTHTEETAMSDLSLGRIMAGLNERQKLVAKCLTHGYTQDQIARRIRKSQATISRTLSLIKAELQKIS
jgi:RNA polymerase sigma factor (sigma-70 family)